MRHRTPKVRHLLRDRMHFNSVQNAITILFSLVSVISMLILTLLLWGNFFRQSGENLTASTQKMIDQARQNMETILENGRQVSNAAYYDAIQENAMSGPGVSDSFALLCEANKDKVLNIALYDMNGKLLAASPVAISKSGVDVVSQDWFKEAMGQIENVHISLPHVQHLFQDSRRRYEWVVSLSRIVELNEGDTSRRGVLLVDLDYDALASAMEQLNDAENGQYYYLCDSSGNMIYHPEMMLIQRKIQRENSKEDASRDDGVHEETFQGQKRTVVVQTISYTGWKLVGVIPSSSRMYGMSSMTLSVLAILLIVLMIILALNRFISSRISEPLSKLNRSVKDYEAGERPEIYCGGTEEIQHLGRSIQKSYEQIEELIQQIIYEQNERRKDEIDALQGQIHPHFLYNTLDSITWMVEGGRDEDAVRMISDLGRLLRISLSKGRTIISIHDEMQHAMSYMSIQKVRYKERFASEFDVDPKVEECCTVKLIVQPVLENAIYYGVGDMDPDDGGKITVTGRIVGENVVLKVTDNGAGMPEEMLDGLLDDSDDRQELKHGNGVGLVNVNKRIQLIFGREYGLTIQSEPDCGTTVTITFPAVPFSPENQKKLEKGTWRDLSSEGQK